MIKINYMKILVNRIYTCDRYTIGHLYIDGKYVCDTLEDADRGLSQDQSLDYIKKHKIPGKTAIPVGTYEVDMNTVSPKFKDRSWAKPYGGKLPWIKGIPGYDRVLMHVGNTEADTDGCVLCGFNKVKGKIINSTEAFNKVMSILGKNEGIKITISKSY